MEVVVKHINAIIVQQSIKCFVFQIALNTSCSIEIVFFKIELLKNLSTFSLKKICPVRAMIFKVISNMLVERHQVKESILKSLTLHCFVLLYKLVSCLLQFVTLKSQLFSL